MTAGEIDNTYGCVGCHYDAGSEARNAAVDRAIAAAMASIEPGTLFEVRAKPVPYAGRHPHGINHVSREDRAERFGIAWLAVPDSAGPEIPRRDEADAVVMDGFRVVARIRA